VKAGREAVTSTWLGRLVILVCAFGGAKTTPERNDISKLDFTRWGMEL
jgi:hypothetical protein